MKKILFICYGNIGRSPMAEFVFKHLVHERGLDDSFEIASAAASSVSVGRPMELGTRKQLAEHGIPFTDRVARKMTKEDYRYYDMIICMDGYNVYDLNRMTGNDPDHKISLLLEYAGRAGEEVADPYFTLNYDAAWRDIKMGCEGLLTHCLAILKGDSR